MELVVNGARRQCPDGVTVASLVAERTDGGARVAVAVNGAVVPRSQWDETDLRDGDAVELLTAVAGG